MGFFATPEMKSGLPLASGASQWCGLLILSHIIQLNFEMQLFLPFGISFAQSSHPGAISFGSIIKF